MVYIDMNMARAGVVKHPAEWPFCGYNQLLGNRKRFTLINVPALMHLMKINSADELKATYAEWIKNTLDHGNLWWESLWTESVAVGSQEFVKRTAAALGIKSKGKKRLTWAEHGNCARKGRLIGIFLSHKTGIQDQIISNN